MMWPLRSNNALQTDKVKLSCLLSSQKPRQLTFAAELAVALVLAALPGLGSADHVVVLATNYDLKLSVDKTYNSRVRSRPLVRSGNEIPILLRDFKIDLRISKTSSEEFLAQVVVFEKSGSGWYRVTIKPLEFAGALGAPTQYSWKSGGMAVDLAIVVGVHER